MDNIIYYISNNLNNPTAARNLTNKFINSANNILQFPYGLAVYNSFGKLKRQYRDMKVDNFLMFYTIDEKDKIITITRVLYQKININSTLEK